MTDEMILVPRAELLAWAKAWKNAYDPNDGTDCVTPFDLYLTKPAAVDDLNAWRAAFIAERATRYREGGMKIEQARIHAETDATLMEKIARQQQGGAA